MRHIFIGMSLLLWPVPFAIVYPSHYPFHCNHHYPDWYYCTCPFPSPSHFLCPSNYLCPAIYLLPFCPPLLLPLPLPVPLPLPLLPLGMLIQIGRVILALLRTLEQQLETKGALVRSQFNLLFFFLISSIHDFCNLFQGNNETVWQSCCPDCYCFHALQHRNVYLCCW